MQKEFKWETREENHDLVIFTLTGDILCFEVIPEGAYGPEEKQGFQKLEEFIQQPYPWIRNYPGLHERAVDRIRQFLHDNV